MRLILLFTFLFLLINASPAQVTELDSPDRLILKAKSDIAHINLENKRNKIISRMNVDSAMVNNKRIIREANAIHYTNGVASARLNLATNYCIKDEFALGRQNLDKALQMFRSVPDSAGICDNWSGNGMFYGMQSKYDSYIACLEKAIAFAEKNDLINNLSVFFGNLAIGHQMQSYFRNAIYYQQKSLALAKATNDKAGIAHTSLNMGLTYNKMGDTARARCFLLDAVEPARSEKLNNVELYAYSNLADLFNNKTDKKKAYDFALKAANPGVKMGDQGIQPTLPARVPGWDYLLVKM